MKTKKYIHHLVSFAVLAVISIGLFSSMPVSATTCPSTNFTEMAGICIPSGTGLPDPDATGKNAVATVLSKILTWMLGLFGVVGMISFVISGTTYLTAAGDAEREKRAKRGMELAIIGMIVGLVGLIALRTVGALLSASA